MIPTDEGLKVNTTTQWTDGTQTVVAQLCGIPKNR